MTSKRSTLDMRNIKTVLDEKNAEIERLQSKLTVISSLAKIGFERVTYNAKNYEFSQIQEIAQTSVFETGEDNE